MPTVYHYDEKVLNTLAILFAPGFIHLGSQEWTSQLCQDLDLAGRKVLDFGSGAGGPACLIAKQYDAQITGLESSPLLIEQSKALAAHSPHQGRIDFTLMSDLPLPINNKFDLIMSINTISLYKEKDQLFSELSQVLRGSGMFITMDWFHKSSHYTEATQAFFKFTDNLFYLNTPQEYLQRLEKNKLSYVNFKDNTKNIRQLCEDLITTLKTEHQEQIIMRWGAEYFEWWLEYWSLLLAALQSGDLLTGHVSGTKT